ncbi:uncharacterized protein [Musca autumnalis]|uniref:uncharacterized protein n=1 Tax=Musca autumnalis TaxID=221902 RepID=UPI003CEC4720
MSEKEVSIKTEPVAEDHYNQANSNNDTHTLCGDNRTKLEHFTYMVNYIKKDELDMDKMEEFLPENIDVEPTIDVIKKEDDVDEMEEFLPEDSTSSLYTPSLLTCKSNDRIEVITHDLGHHHQHFTQQHLTCTTTQQISLPKLEINDVDTDEDDDCKVLKINSGDTDTNVSDNKERSVTCELCDRSYTDDSSLQRHVRYKHSLYICEICNERYTTKKGLVAHSSRLHPGAHSSQAPDVHICEVCGRCYVGSQNLWFHIRNKHPLSIDPDYICEICNQRFMTQKGLDRHSYRMHQVAHSTQHTCELCGSYFRQKQNLRRHMRKKHPLPIYTYIY